MPKDTETIIVELLKGLKDDIGKIEDVSLADMAETTGLSISTVQRAIKSLEDKGVITTYRRKSTEPQVILYKNEELVEMIEQAESAIELCKIILQGIKDKMRSQ